jgi:hypothetical protein
MTLAAAVATLIATQRIEQVPADRPSALMRLTHAEDKLEAAREIATIDVEVAYVTAYDATRIAVTAHMLAAGYRARGVAGAHEAVRSSTTRPNLHSGGHRHTSGRRAELIVSAPEVIALSSVSVPYTRVQLDACASTVVSLPGVHWSCLGLPLNRVTVGVDSDLMHEPLLTRRRLMDRVADGIPLVVVDGTARIPGGLVWFAEGHYPHQRRIPRRPDRGRSVSSTRRYPAP